MLARFDDASCIQYLLLICRQIKDALVKGEYLDALLDRLADIINESISLNNENKNAINKYTELIIAEFIVNGVVAEDLTRIIEDFEKKKDLQENVDKYCNSVV